MSETDRDQDVTDLLREQHHTIRALIAQVRDSSGDARRDSFEALVRLLAVHETSEELVVHPTAATTGDEGRRVVEARKREEDAAKKQLAELESLGPTHDRFVEHFEPFAAAVEAHARAEEETVFLLIDEHVDQDRRDGMATVLRAAQTVAPTHAHRAAPEGALGNLVVGPWLAVVDRVRDAIRDAAR